LSRVRIAVLDSGVHAGHPHIGNLGEGVHIAADGEAYDTVDRLGHGTAIAAVIHHLAPDAEIIPVKIFDRSLSTNLSIIVRAVNWCLKNKIQVINLSLGTTNSTYRETFAEMNASAHQAGSVIVSAYRMGEVQLLPGSMPGVVGVIADERCDPLEYSVHTLGGKVVFGALPFPREIPGVPRQANLNGVSFAVGRVSAQIGNRWLLNVDGQDWPGELVRAQTIEAATRSAAR